MNIKINGEEHFIEENKTISEILDQLSLKPESIAIAINYQVLPKTAYTSRLVKEGDKLEIIHAVQGG